MSPCCAWGYLLYKENRYKFKPLYLTFYSKDYNNNCSIIVFTNPFTPKYIANIKSNYTYYPLYKFISNYYLIKSTIIPISNKRLDKFLLFYILIRILSYIVLYPFY